MRCVPWLGLAGVRASGVIPRTKTRCHSYRRSASGLHSDWKLDCPFCPQLPSFTAFAAMSISLDSPAYFQERLDRIGFDADGITRITTGRGGTTVAYTTFGEFATATSWTPGNGGDDRLVADVVTPLFGEHPGANLGRIRRFFIEAYTLLASDLKHRLERTGDDPPKKMPRVERLSRLERVMAQVQGVSANAEEVEPGPNMVNLFNTMAEEADIEYISWGRRTSAAHEKKFGKKVTDYRPNKIGQVVERREDEVPEMKSITTVHKFDTMMLRTSVCWEVAELLPRTSHDLWRTRLVELMDDDPADASKYDPVSLAQCARADEELWRLLTWEVRGLQRVRKDGADRYPLQEPFVRLMKDARLVQIFTHLLKPGGADAATKEKQKKLQEQIASLRGQVQQLQSRVGGKGNGWHQPQAPPKNDGGKGKGKHAKRDRRPAPRERVGGDLQCPDGSSKCYAFNLEGCSKAPPGAQCDNGWHYCTVAGCKNPSKHGKRGHSSADDP